LKFIEIISPCAVKGKSQAVGDIPEFDDKTADDLVAIGKAKYSTGRPKGPEVTAKKGKK